MASTPSTLSKWDDFVTKMPLSPVLLGKSEARICAQITDKASSHNRTCRLTQASGIGLETCILFAREGANILMADISAAALEKASAKLKQLVPSHHKVEITVCHLNITTALGSSC